MLEVDLWFVGFVFFLCWKKSEESDNFLCHWKIISQRQCVAEAANRLFNGVYPNESVNSSSRLQPQARFLLHHLCLISLEEKKKNHWQSHPKKTFWTISFSLLFVPSCS